MAMRGLIMAMAERFDYGYGYERFDYGYGYGRYG
jgi:hypothetical protein